jgi:hypothetical protein
MEKARIDRDFSSWKRFMGKGKYEPAVDESR